MNNTLEKIFRDISTCKTKLYIAFLEDNYDMKIMMIEQMEALLGKLRLELAKGQIGDWKPFS